jgi:hypothetical protein
MHPIGIAILATLLYFVSFGARRHAAAAMVAGVLYLTQGQSIDVAINFYAIRILGIAMFARVLLRHEFSFRKLGEIDRVFVTLYAYTATVFLVRSRGNDLATVAGAFDACFCYFGFRGLIKGREDLTWLLRAVFVLLIPYALLILAERVRGLSVFIFMGGPAGGWERDGVARCMGSFRYPVSLGTFAGTFLALYIGLLKSKREAGLSKIAIAICLWLVYASNSGGSITAAGVAIVAWILWRFRRNMRAFRWSIVGLLVLLAFIMKAPVWFILDRISLGGDSWHRAYLIDVALRDIGKWWLVGMNSDETAKWFPYTVNGSADITNQYLVFGLNAGIGAIVLFITLLSRVFGRVGKAMVRLRAQRAPAATRYMVWGLGATLAVHVVGWFGVSYFDQIYVIWFLQLACIVSITDEILSGRGLKPNETAATQPVAAQRTEPAMAWG